MLSASGQAAQCLSALSSLSMAPYAQATWRMNTMKILLRMTSSSHSALGSLRGSNGRMRGREPEPVYVAVPSSEAVLAVRRVGNESRGTR